MTEAESSEVEKVLLHVSEARSRARKAKEGLGRAGAAPHVVAALEGSVHELDQLHRRLSQATFYAVPDERLELAS